MLRIDIWSDPGGGVRVEHLHPTLEERYEVLEGELTVHIDGRAVKSCTVMVGQAAGSSVTTIEGIAKGDELHPMQAAFRDNHGLQCGYCTPGMIMSAIDIVHRHSGQLDEETVRQELEGNICRCTGYHNIVKAVLDAAGRMKVSQAAE